MSCGHEIVLLPIDTLLIQIRQRRDLDRGGRDSSHLLSNCLRSHAKVALMVEQRIRTKLRVGRVLLERFGVGRKKEQKITPLKASRRTGTAALVRPRPVSRTRRVHAVDFPAMWLQDVSP